MRTSTKPWSQEPSSSDRSSKIHPWKWKAWKLSEILYFVVNLWYSQEYYVKFENRLGQFENMKIGERGMHKIFFIQFKQKLFKAWNKIVEVSITS